MQQKSAPINQIRKKSRSKGDAWIAALLHKVEFGMLATEFEGQPFIKPTSFAFDEAEHAIYIHGALVGRMRTNIELNPRVSFCIADMGRLLPAATACDVGVEFASAVVFGTLEVVRDASQARYGLQLMLDRYFPHLKPDVDYMPIQEHDLQTTAVYRLRITAWSGKEKQASPDFPGAFNYPAA